VTGHQAKRLATAEARGTRRRHQLDGLRGVAVLFVIAVHSVTEFAQRVLYRAHLRYLGDGLVATLSSALELFFVLSGVLILGPLLRGRRTFDRRAYYRRRALRVWPPYLGALLFGGIVILIARSDLTWYSIQEIPSFSIERWAAQLGVVNFGWTAYNGAWWSLTLEVVFYLLVPIILVLMAHTWSSWGMGALLGVSIGILISSFFLAVFPARIDPAGVVQLGFSYVPCFLLGILIARFDPPARTGIILVVVGTVGILVAVGDSSLNRRVPFGIFWAGVVVIATKGFLPLYKVLASRYLVWVGERSYSLFLVHFSVFYLVDYCVSLVEPGRTVVFDIATRAIGLPLAFLVGMTLFWTVERRQARGLVTADSFWPWEIRRFDEVGLREVRG
jgi:peptidoglycan/LPS O-acetylase OafA/YrhL